MPPERVHPLFSSASRKEDWKVVMQDSILEARFGAIDRKDTSKGTDNGNSTKDGDLRVSVAAFDLDGTVIKTKSGAVFPKDAQDWLFLFPNVPETLKKIHEAGHRIVVFSNQKNLLKREKKLAHFKIKCASLAKKLDIPIHFLVAVKNGRNRKPCWGMFEYLQNQSLPLEINMDTSFYVGDAAGRLNDFACSDRQFGLNAGLTFHTPEEYFLNHSDIPFRCIHPSSLLPDDVTTLHSPASYPLVLKPPRQELVIFVGSPASGKTSFFHTYFAPQGYTHVNQDTLKTPQRCFNKVEETLLAGISCVVDNTNPQASTRFKYISLATSLKIPIRCLYHTAAKQICLHNNGFRCFTTDIARLPDIAFNIFFSKLEIPKKEEGFDAVLHINFIPTDERWHKYY